MEQDIELEDFGLCAQRKLSDPERVDVRNSAGKLLATLTCGSRAVALSGPERNFSEADASVTHKIWVRTLPRAFTGQVDADWLTKALSANEQGVPDVLTIAMQYIDGAPSIIDQDGFQIAGDAGYGPLRDGKREEGSDFNDYLGISWEYVSEGVDGPEHSQFRCLDCSGYMRMIWGYRHNFAGSGYADSLPLSLNIRPDSSALPRRAWEICVGGPGTLVVPNQGIQVTDLSKLLIGDLVFFDADRSDGAAIDHVGMFIGIDSKQRYRFISSRKAINGPTLKDFHGESLLDGEGLYARGFRAARRL